MKPVIRPFFTLFLALFSFAPSVAMDVPTPESLKKGQYGLHFSIDKPMVKEIIEAINTTPQGGLIAMNGSHISHDDILEALGQAQARGVRLELCVDARKKDNKKLLKKLAHNGLLATCLLHTKRCIILDVDPKDNPEAVLAMRSALVFTGSENLSNVADKNYDYTFVSRIKDCVKAHYEDHLLNKNLCAQYKEQESAAGEFHRAIIDHDSKERVLISPRFMRICNSQRVDSSRLKEARIAKPVPADAKECFYLSTMSFDDILVTNALCKKLQEGSRVIMLVHIDAVRSDKGLRQLNQLNKAGAQIHVWMKDTPIQHTKLLLRERRNKLDDHYLDALAVLSTGNLVETSRIEINYDKIIPESHAISEDIRAYFNKMIPNCKPFAQINQQDVAEKKALKKANKGKDVVTLACGTCREQIVAPAEKTLIKKFLKHCINKHERCVANTLAIENVEPKTLYCASCPECEAPFYTQVSANAATLCIAKHRIKDHAVGEVIAQKARKNTSVAKAAFSIAENQVPKKYPTSPKGAKK